MNLKKFSLKKLNLDKTKTLILIGVLTLLLFVGGATYAYFAFSSANPTQGNMEIISNTVDNLMFNIEKEIYINANLENFGQGMADLHDDTDATATLIPNNYDNQASAMYNIYLIIEANDLEYTTSDNTPELLLNVTDPNGNPLENITGLVHYDNGFDITTRTGGFLIASDYVINASNIAEVQTWNVEITLANLDSNQNANMNKTFSAKLYLTQDKMSSYNPVQITNVSVTPTYNSINTSLNFNNGTADVDKYYFGIEETNTTTGYINNNNGVVRLNNNILASADTVEYIESDTPNYEFTNLKENTEYTIYSYVVDVNNIKSNVYETQVVTSEYDLPSVGSVTHSVTLNSITLTVNASSGDGNITKYMYSKDNGNSWEESTSNTHTFTGLNDTTEYKIKIKVVDSNGRESTEYYEAISTETYILPIVANVEYDTTYNSITLTPSGTDGTNTIDHYEYSINNGAYQTNNVFNNLNEQTEYTVSVKAIDSNGRESNPYTIQVTTDTYQVPVISNVTTSSTTNSITINVTASNGDGTITKYMYSRDNGSNWYESTINSYTLDNLTSNTTFYVQVKVVDNNNRESAVSNTTVTTQYINPVVNSVSASNITSNSVTLTVNATAGSNSIATYYYSNNNGSSYVSSSSNTYTFSGLNSNTTYNFRVYVVDSGGAKSNEATTNATTETGTLANYIKSLYTVDGDNGLYYHDGQGSYTNANLEAGDNSYRYAGANPNNYVCFGSDASTCPYDNLYRIIGVFDDEVKLIKADYALEEQVGFWRDDVENVYYDELASNTTYQKPYTTAYYKGSLSVSKIPVFEYVGEYYGHTWNDDDINTNALNTIYINYLNSINTKWSNMIEEHEWQSGGFVSSYYDNDIHQWYYLSDISVKTLYDYEVGVNALNVISIGKIGLMYVTDSDYAANPINWNASSTNNINDNWLVMGLWELTISLHLNGGGGSFMIDPQGSISYGYAMEDFWCTIRPTFYLNSNVEYVSGLGTSSDPIRIQ